MRLLAAVVVMMAALPAQASVECREAALPQALPVRPTLLAPVAEGFSAMNPQLGSQRGVLAPAFDESQSVDNVLLRQRLDECRKVTAAAQAAAERPDPAAYVKRTEHDNTPYRFNMTQNGRRMTADDFDAWLKANGYSAGRRADSTAAPAEAGEAQATKE